jgi:hypothetical protein
MEELSADFADFRGFWERDFTRRRGGHGDREV